MEKIFIEEAVTELHTIQDMIRWTVSRLNDSQAFFGHGTDNAWDEAVQLILPALYLPMDVDPEVRHARLTLSERQKLVELVIRRVQEKVPTAYLTNQAWFAGLEFYVDERVLVPRSPFAELIQNHFQPWLTREPARVLDLCTGSGCIGIAAAYAFPDAEVDLVDLSEDAIEVADINIQRHGLAHQVTPIQSDLFKGIQGQTYDLIITNPPYVDAEDMASLPEEFGHEPELGLAAGFDGLDIFKRIIANAPRHLNDHGLLFIEVGNSQVHVEEQYPELPLTWLQFEHGGHGVCVISKEQLAAYQEQFSQYLDTPE